jgi:hypothetical protein
VELQEWPLLVWVIFTIMAVTFAISALVIAASNQVPEDTHTSAHELRLSIADCRAVGGRPVVREIFNRPDGHPDKIPVPVRWTLRCK